MVWDHDVSLCDVLELAEQTERGSEQQGLVEMSLFMAGGWIR